MSHGPRTCEGKLACLLAAVVGLSCAVVGMSFSAAAEGPPAEAVIVGKLLEDAGISRGLSAVLGCDDGTMVLELARRSDLVLHVWEPRRSAVARARRLADREGLYGTRITIERGVFEHLPYADNTIDLVLALGMRDRGLERLPVAEVLRVLRPGGKAILGMSRRIRAGGNPEGRRGRLTRPRLEAWLRAAGIDGTAVKEDQTGLWGHLVKPPLAGVDEWTHWEHGPDNNPVSTDAAIKAPYMTQWFGLPYYIPMPAITTAAGGRMFLAMGHIAHHQREESWLNALVARNGYNGIVLWTRKLPDGYLAHRSAFIATPDTFYMIDVDGTGILLLDPETGERKGRIEAERVKGDWKWIAMKDGLLFALVGREKDPPETTIVRSPRTHWSWGELSRGYYARRIPWGFGSTILAYDMEMGRVVWTHDEDAPIDSRAMVLGGDRLYYYCPDARVGCLTARSGAVVWKNDDPRVRELIEEPGRSLGSTPGFRTCCYALYTPKALCYQAQTRMNVVAVSLEDGRYLWHRKKTTNNPNMLYLDGRLLVGIGPGGSTLVLDPATGETIEDLGFRKRSCARLTATPDSLFCRGWPEGLTRYDRIHKRVLFNGAFRPPCNDGVIGANGLLYVSPWTCDCNLSLMGAVAMCSAGDFDFERRATDAERLEVGEGDIHQVAPLEVSENDWTAYRGSPSRSASTGALIGAHVKPSWRYGPPAAFAPTAPAAAGGLVFLGGSDGKVRAIDARTGELKWTFFTAGPILAPPTIWNGRAYVGSGDGYIYALEAATGRLLWRFRAAPVERRIMAYGSLCSTWPVNTGVLVEDGVAYAAAGTIDYDGTYVYALDAITGKLKWENNRSGHLDEDLRKGVSAQGILTTAKGRLWMPGGNVVSPVAYDSKTGKYLSGDPGNGSPRANRGEEVGVIGGRHLVLGGRLRFSARENVVNPGNFVAIQLQPGGEPGAWVSLSQGKIPPVWDDKRIVVVDGLASVPKAYSIEAAEKRLAEGDSRKRIEPTWQAPWGDRSDVVSLALAGNAVVAACEVPQPGSLAPRWVVRALSPENGQTLWELRLPGAALPGGLLVDRDGRVVVVLEDGRLICFGGERII